ncbi:iron chaperone [Corynebacterium choanae]|uniref:YdhG-like domain-containing protein n=1 Tax=Corynebacterium choanae TaxID=1862358 RepID=A0A3G6J3I2_9CORY|nr:DUF1801 domain-containing protein [Corynebacterium choanae]AZA12625.1 hypothetical protein CCHOA_00985 [Corynebacterium choanae]
MLVVVGRYTSGVMAINTVDDYLATLTDQQRPVVEAMLEWVGNQYPMLELRIAWNQPMFTDHGTFIIGFSAAKGHLAIAPEEHTVAHFAAELDRRGVRHTKMLIRQPWDEPLDTALVGELIDYQRETKRDVTSFWRPKS